MSTTDSPKKRTKKSVSTSKKRRRKRKKILILLIYISLFLISIQTTLFFFGKDLFKTIIQQSITSSTNGNYSLEFENLRINFAFLELSLQNNHFAPTPQFYLNNPNKKEKSFEFKSDEIKLQGMNLLKLIQDNELHAFSFKIIEPNIIIKNKKLDKEENEEVRKKKKEKNIYEIQNKIHQTITSVFSIVSIGKIQLVTSNINFFLKKKINLKKKNLAITFTLEKFYLEKEKENSSLLFSDNIKIDIKNFHYLLKNKEQKIIVQELKANLKEEKISFYGLKLVPTSTEKKNMTNIDIAEGFIILPKIQEDWKKNNLVISIIEFKGGDFTFDKSIIGQNKRNERDKSKQKFSLKMLDNLDLYPLIRNFYNSLIITDINLLNSKIKIRDYEKGKNILNIKSINCAINEFIIDSLGKKNQDRFLNSKNINGKINDLEFLIDQESHHLSIKNILFNTSGADISAEKIKLIPLSNQIKQKNKLSINLPSMKIHKIDLKKYLYKKNLEIDKIDIKDLSINITQQSKERKTTLFNLLKKYYKQLKINEISITTKEFDMHNLATSNINKKIYFKSASLSLKEIYSKRKKRSKTYILGNQIICKSIDLDINDYSMGLSDNLHNLKMKNFNFSTQDKNLNITKFSILSSMAKTNAPMKPVEVYNIKVPTVEMQNFDLVKNLNYNVIEIGTLYLKNPIVNVSKSFESKKSNKKTINPYLLFRDYISHIDVLKLRIENGVLKVKDIENKKTVLEQEHLNLESDFFRIDKNSAYDKNRIFYSKTVVANVQKMNMELKDNVHQLTLNQVFLDTHREIFSVKSAKFSFFTKKMDTIKHIKTLFDISIPNIDFGGINYKNIYHNNTLFAQNMKFDSPEIKVYINKNYSGSKRGNKWSEIDKKMSKYIDDIYINKLDLVKGRMKIFKLKKDKSSLVIKSNANLTLNQVKLNEDILKNIDKVLYAKGVYLNLRDFSLKLDNTNHYLKATEINIENNKAGSVYINNFHLYKKNDISKRDNNPKTNYDMIAPVLTLQGFDMDDAILNYKYHLDEINLFNAVLIIKEKKNNKTTNKNLYEQIRDAIPNSFDLIFKKVNIKNFQLESHTLPVDNFHLKKDLYSNIDMNIDDFILTPQTTAKTKNVLFSKNISFSMPSLNIKTADSLYMLKTENISFLTKKQTLNIGSVRLIPRYGLIEFGRIKGEQTDRFDFSAKNIKSTTFDFSTLFLNKKIITNNIEIDNFTLSVFRDKNLPRDDKKPYPSSLQGLISQIKTPINVRSLYAHNGLIKYQEISKNGTITKNLGEITLDNVSIKGQNIKTFKSSDKMKISLEAMLMKKGELKVILDAPLNNQNMRVKGSLGAIPITAFNQMLKKTTNFSIKSGTNHRFSFDFSTNKNKAEGSSFFFYDDLKLNIHKSSGKKQGFTSFLANTFVVREENKEGESFREGKIQYNRSLKRGPINYIFKSALSGVKHSLGIKKKSTKNKK